MNTPLGKISRDEGGYKVVFNKTLNHPIEKIWQAITDPNQLKFWFTDIEMDFRPGGKMKIQFRDADKTISEAEIVSIEPPHKFVWTWEGELAVWELTKLNTNKTELKLTYSKLSKEYAIKAPAGFHALLDRLEERLEGSEESFAFGAEVDNPEHIKTQIRYAADTYNEYPEIVINKPVIVEKKLDASVEKVWKALTDTGQMKQWYFDLDRFETREGFQFRFSGQGHKGEQYMHICTIIEVIAQRRLQYSWEYEGIQGYSIVTFDLIPEGTKTKLTLTHHGLDTFPQDNADFGWNSFNEGWNHIINKSLTDFIKGISKNLR